MAATLPNPDPTRPAPSSPHIVPLLILATLAAYWPVLGHAFLSWDDQYFLWRNPLMNPPTASSLRVWWTTPQLELYVPLTWTVWAGIACLARVPPDAAGIALDARYFHAANLLVHVVAVLLAYRLLRVLVRHPWPAAAGALLFALHPVQVQAVAWASALKDVLCGALSLAALALYVSAVDPKRGDRVRLGPYLVASAVLALATLAKPGAVVVPFIAVLIDRLLLRRDYARIARTLLPWVVLVVPCLAWTRWAQPPRDFGMSAPLWARPFVAADAVAFYLYKLVWPAHLGPDYQRTPWYIERHDYIYYTWLATLAAALALVRLRQLRRLPTGVLAGTMAFLVALGPVLGFVRFNSQNLSTVADHYLYLPMIGVALCVAAALAKPWCLVPRRRGRMAMACALILAVLGVRTWFQTWHWRNDAVFFPHAKSLHRFG